VNEAETRVEHIDPALESAGWSVVESRRGDLAVHEEKTDLHNAFSRNGLAVKTASAHDQVAGPGRRHLRESEERQCWCPQPSGSSPDEGTNQTNQSKRLNHARPRTQLIRFLRSFVAPDWLSRDLHRFLRRAIDSFSSFLRCSSENALNGVEVETIGPSLTSFWLPTTQASAWRTSLANCNSAAQPMPSAGNQSRRCGPQSGYHRTTASPVARSYGDRGYQGCRSWTDRTGKDRGRTGSRGTDHGASGYCCRGVNWA